uniref:Uncharacterized protein n=1 Tax=Arundo donax TaxID=35708 RepID=A0A0A9EKP6_ARUDO
MCRQEDKVPVSCCPCRSTATPKLFTSNLLFVVHDCMVIQRHGDYVPCSLTDWFGDW